MTNESKPIKKGLKIPNAENVRRLEKRAKRKKISGVLGTVGNGIMKGVSGDVYQGPRVASPSEKNITKAQRTLDLAKRWRAKGKTN